jgi:hypothetical protein
MIHLERRIELAMEALRYMDLVRTGKYMDYLDALSGNFGYADGLSANCQSHSITNGVVNPVPVLPIPLAEVQTWGLEQNPGY